MKASVYSIKHRALQRARNEARIVLRAARADRIGINGDDGEASKPEMNENKGAATH